jgi:hypothetical protein
MKTLKIKANKIKSNKYSGIETEVSAALAAQGLDVANNIEVVQAAAFHIFYFSRYQTGTDWTGNQ